MIKCSVLEGFLRATQGTLNITQEDDRFSDTSSGDGYHQPGMSQCILAPDACFNFK